MIILKWFPLFITVKNISAKWLGFEWLQKPYEYVSFETDRLLTELQWDTFAMFFSFFLSLFFSFKVVLEAGGDGMHCFKWECASPSFPDVWMFTWNTFFLKDLLLHTGIGHLFN